MADVLAGAPTISISDFMRSRHAGLHRVLSEDGRYEVYTGIVRGSVPTGDALDMHRFVTKAFIDELLSVPCNISGVRRKDSDYELPFNEGFAAFCLAAQRSYYGPCATADALFGAAREFIAPAAAGAEGAVYVHLTERQPAEDEDEDEDGDEFTGTFEHPDDNLPEICDGLYVGQTVLSAACRPLDHVKHASSSAAHSAFQAILDKLYRRKVRRAAAAAGHLVGHRAGHLLGVRLRIFCLIFLCDDKHKRWESLGVAGLHSHVLYGGANARPGGDARHDADPCTGGILLYDFRRFVEDWPDARRRPAWDTVCRWLGQDGPHFVGKLSPTYASPKPGINHFHHNMMLISYRVLEDAAHDRRRVRTDAPITIGEMLAVGAMPSPQHGPRRTEPAAGEGEGEGEGEAAGQGRGRDGRGRDGGVAAAAVADRLHLISGSLSGGNGAFARDSYGARAH